MAPPRIEDRLARRGGAVELLRLPAAVFGAVSGLRSSLYDRGLLPVERLDAPVVSVGNLTAGGTGKTPMVALLAQRLRARGRRPGLLSRGYGSRRGAENDEARLLAELLPDVAHVQDPDRAAGGRRLVEQHGVDVVLLDDGFQHRRLHRDLDLVLVDATRPWGLPPDGANREPVRALLPRGLLREHPRNLARAHAVVLTRVDQAAHELVAGARAQVARWAPHLPVLTAEHRPVSVRARDGGRSDPRDLAGREVDLISGIGNPQAFEDSVRGLGATVRSHRRLPDHHDHSAADLDGLGAGGGWVLTTAKDAVKLRDLPASARIELRVLDVELVLRDGDEVLEALLDSLPESRAQRERSALHEGLHG